ncbi:MAG: penicillin-binding transpeptidase domain-containing protein [Lachnospiraceae bacterium]|nr:penicillin-binding transpeptidase domain-containing protein [Lachnospiraceae bacterium]
MALKIKKMITRAFSHRTVILMLFFTVLTSILILRCFSLQIIHGKDYANNFKVMTTKTRKLKSSRGNIYDKNGKLLAYNELANSVTIEDSGTYPTTREKQLSLNGEIYRLIQLIQENGDDTDDDFHIFLDSNNNYVYDLREGTALKRFRADVFGRISIDDMDYAEMTATPDRIIEELSSAERFGLVNEKKPYTAEELSSHGLPETLSKEEALKIIIVRYQLSLTSYRKYLSVTVASNVSDATVAAIKENSGLFQGVAISEDSIRVYNNPYSTAAIIGYTGKPSSQELSELNTKRNDYTSESIIGKTGIEAIMETYLQGNDGSEEVTVDNLGRVLATNEESYVAPVQGNDVYLTIDSELQEACYRILEQRIAGILVSNIQKVKTVEDATPDPEDEDAIPIPIYDVYIALFRNSVIDIDHFSDIDASDIEKSVLDKFESKRKKIYSMISSELTGSSSTQFSSLTEELQEYETYIVEDFLMKETGILDSGSINYYDKIYLSWKEGEISLKDFLAYAVSQNWIDVSIFAEEDTYLNSTEVYQTLAYTIQSKLETDASFSKLIYKYMLLNDQLSPEEVVKLCYAQGILNKEDGDYDLFRKGDLSAADLMLNKVSNLDITPAQLALDPCSGSVVVVDPDNGEVRALVSYPGYDNNRLANNMDTAYYNALYNDLSTPFYNKATQQLTAPGSTFKPVMAAAGLTEGAISEQSVFNCNGLFGEGLVGTADQIHCWDLDGHGDLDIVGGIANSCNVVFCTVGYNLGLQKSDVADIVSFNQDQALSTIQKYASMFDLGKKSGIELTESSPKISDDLALPSSIGQGTHLYTTTGLARYAATLSNSGTSYDLRLLDKVVDHDDEVIKKYESRVSSKLDLSQNVWDDIHTGMRGVITSSAAFENFPVELSGKTGTAQESSARSNHALFVGYSHYGDQEEDIAMAVRIAYGYSSSNCMMVAKDMLSYYYNLQDETEILTGTSDLEGITNLQHD